ncbi:MAG: hypothetical protein N3A38_15675, partial [Planctomycetota bacterium]|nr:hypothetical protein [Planctomycetota bacterium]
WLDMPQKLWGLFVESGFTEPFARDGWWAVWTWVAASIPVSVFAATFAVAAMARSRTGVGFSWLAGLLIAGAIFAGTWLAYELISRAFFMRQTGPGTREERIRIWIPCVAVLVGAAASALVGHGLFALKEGISRPAPARGRSLWWVWALIGLIISVLLVLLWCGRSSVPVPSAEEPTPERDRARP